MMRRRGGVLLAAKEALLIGHRGAEVPCMTNGSAGMDGPAEMHSWAYVHIYNRRLAAHSFTCHSKENEDTEKSD